MSNKIRATALIVMVGAGSAHAIETVNFRTGIDNFTFATTDLAVGQSDSFASGVLPFAGAAGGSNAFTLPGLAAGWASDLGDGSGSKWIGWRDDAWSNSLNTGRTALYAHKFNLSQSWEKVTLTVKLAVDDYLGDANNQGIFVNGTAVPGSVIPAIPTGGSWQGIYDRTFDITSLVNAGSNTIYFNVWNSGNGPSGIMLNGSVQAVPEPGTMIALALGASALVARRRRNRE